MITTAPGTTLLTLEAGDGQTHLDGWTFALAGDGEHDHLFTVVDNEVKAGAEYITPGTKNIRIKADFAGTPSVYKDIAVAIGETGMLRVTTTGIALADDHLPEWTDDYRILLSWSKSDVDTPIELFHTTTWSHITHNLDNSISIFDEAGNQVYNSGTLVFEEGVWHTLKVVREDRGVGARSHYTVDDALLFASTPGLLLQTPNIGIAIRPRTTDVGDVYVSNILIDIDGERCVHEELDVGTGTFIPYSND